MARCIAGRVGVGDGKVLEERARVLRAGDVLAVNVWYALVQVEDLVVYCC